LRLKRPQFVGLGGNFCGGGINLKYIPHYKKNTDRSSVYAQEKIKNKKFNLNKNKIYIYK
jgi:hypothetical protein